MENLLSSFSVFITVCFILSFFWIITAFYIKGRHFVTSDEPIKINPFVPKQRQEYQSDPATVKVGMLIKNFVEFSVTQNLVVFDAIVWFEFNPSTLNIHDIEHFSVMNAELSKKEIGTIKKTNENIFVEFNIKAKITANFDHRFFPFNDHFFEMSLMIENVSSEEVRFEVSNSAFVLADGIKAYDREIVGKSVRSGYRDLCLEENDPSKMATFPVAIFSLNLARAGIRQLALIFTPIFLLMYIGIYSLSLDPEKYSSSLLSMSALGVTGLLAYRYVIEVLSPKVGYFTLSDHIYTMNLFVSCFVFIVSIVQYLFIENTYFVLELKFFSFLFSEFCVIAGLSYFLFFWRSRDFGTVESSKKKQHHQQVFRSDEINHQFKTLDQMKNHAKQILEYPQIENDDFLNPKFTNYYKKIVSK